MGERNYYQLANLFSFLGKHDREMKSCEKCENGEATGNNIYSFSPCPFYDCHTGKDEILFIIFNTIL